MLVAAVVRPAEQLPEPFALGSQVGVSSEQVLAVVQPFAEHAHRYLREETQFWWEPPLAFAQFADPDQSVRTGAAAYWAGVAEGSMDGRPKGWDDHGILTTHLSAVRQLASTGICPPNLEQQLCVLLLHIPVTNATCETALEVSQQACCARDKFKCQQQLNFAWNWITLVKLGLDIGDC